MQNCYGLNFPPGFSEHSCATCEYHCLHMQPLLCFHRWERSSRCTETFCQYKPDFSTAQLEVMHIIVFHKEIHKNLIAAERPNVVFCSWEVVGCLWCTLCRSWKHYGGSDDKDDQLLLRFNRNLYSQGLETLNLWCLITSTDKLSFPWPDSPAQGWVWEVHALPHASQIFTKAKPHSVTFFQQGHRERGRNALNGPRNFHPKVGVLLRDVLQGAWPSDWLALGQVTAHQLTACKAHLTSSLMPTELVTGLCWLLATY